MRGNCLSAALAAAVFTVACGPASEPMGAEPEAASAESRKEWSATLAGSVAGVAFGEGRNLYVLTGGPGDSRLAKFAPDGAEIWQRRAAWVERSEVNGRPLVANEQGAWALFGAGGGPGAFEGDSFVGSLVVHFDRRGGVVWTRELGDFSIGLALGPDGSVVAITGSSPSPGIRHQRQIIRLDRDGNEVWRQQLPAAQAAAIDSGGNVIVTGLGFVAKLSPSGALAWRRDLGAHANIPAVDVSPQGAIVAAVELSDGSFSWAGETYAHTSAPDSEPRAIVIAADPAGGELWGRLAAPGGGPRVSVAPSGEVALLAGRHCSALQRYDAIGTRLWSGRPTDGPCSRTSIAGANALDLAEDGAMAVGGTYAETQDFGDGPRTATEHGSGFLRIFGR